MPSISFTREHWPIAGGFTISRGSKRSADVIVVEISDGMHRGRGECVPYARYGETPHSVLSQLETLKPEVEAGLTRHKLHSLLAAGAARNALDCALWDLEAKQSKTSVTRLTGRSFTTVETAYTLSLADAATMGNAAKRAKAGILKLKLAGDENDIERVRAVAGGAPQAKLILDPNEGFSPTALAAFLPMLTGLNVVLIEQPLKAQDDSALEGIDHGIPIAADESCHTRADLAQLRGRYDAINIKLDKSGGLTEAIALEEEARTMGFLIMVGCMVSTSLAMAPALLLAANADFVDLDGPLLLEKDRDNGLVYEGTFVGAPQPQLWG